MWRVFDGANFTPHGFCLAWQPGLIWLTASSNLVIALSYFSIPAAIVVLLLRRPDLGYKPVAVLFAAFILACGMTHVFEALDLWMPIYRLAGFTDALTAVLSTCTAVLLWPLLPKIVALPSPTALAKANSLLSDAESATSQANRWLKMGEQLAHTGYWRQICGAPDLACSEEFLRIFDLTPASGEVFEAAVTQQFHADDRQKVRRVLVTAIRQQTGFSTFCRIVRPSGEIRHLQIRGEVQTGSVGDVKTVFGVCIDRTEQAQVEQELILARLTAETAREGFEKVALQDGLTGLANRRHFDKTLDIEVRRRRRDGGHLALIMIDVDNFKAFNDTYGHLAGDACLQAVANVIPTPLARPGDLMARYGGEEFAAIVPGADITAATDLAWKIVEAVRRLDIVHLGGQNGMVTVSVGVASIASYFGEGDGERLTKRADQALYIAKKAGRNRVIAASQSETAHSRQADFV